MAYFSGENLRSIMEPLLLGLTWVVFMRQKGYTQFPAFVAYLSCQLAIFAASWITSQSPRLGLSDTNLAYAAHNYIHWIGYLASAGIAFLVISSIFGRVIEPFPNLHRIGRAAFRWATATAVLLGILSALFPVGPKQDLLSELPYCAMRGVSVLELCLLAFILLSMRTLRFSPKSREFGIALGLAMMASAELATSVFAFRHSTLSSPANYASQILVTLAAMVWAIYSLRPAMETGVVQPFRSATLDRWYEIVGALPEPAPQVYLGTSSGSFFLEDVERVVDKVMQRNAAIPGK